MYVCPLLFVCMLDSLGDQPYGLKGPPVKDKRFDFMWLCLLGCDETQCVLRSSHRLDTAAVQEAMADHVDGWPEAGPRVSWLARLRVPRLGIDRLCSVCQHCLVDALMCVLLTLWVQEISKYCLWATEGRLYFECLRTSCSPTCTDGTCLGVHFGGCPGYSDVFLPIF